MKVLIVGASGMIGSEALTQALAHPAISSVVAFGRRDLPTAISSHPKLQCVQIKDFAAWPEDVLQTNADAAGMIWAMGTNSGSRTADLEYPLAFLESMARVLETKPTRPRFRCVHLSGKFVRQDQEQKLWFLEMPRKLKGLLETRALEFGKDHAAVWQTFIVKPGGVAPKTMTSGGVMGLVTGMGAVMGENWSVRVDQLGAFMAYLVVDGEGEDSITDNLRIVRKGKEVLASIQDSPKS